MVKGVDSKRGMTFLLSFYFICIFLKRATEAEIDMTCAFVAEWRRKTVYEEGGGGYFNAWPLIGNAEGERDDEFAGGE